MKIFRTEKSGGLKEYQRFQERSIIVCEKPTESEMLELSNKFKLDLDMIKDFLDPYESPRVERYNNAVYLYLRRAVDGVSELATEPVLIVKKKDSAVLCFSHTGGLVSPKADVDSTRPTMALLQIAASVNQAYYAKLNAISRRLLAVRGDLRRSEIDNQDIIKFIDIEEDLVEYEAALTAQKAALTMLLSGRIMKLYEDDADLVEDLTLGIGQLLELVRSRRSMIAGIRETYTTITTNNLNKMFKRLTSISIFMTIPTVIGGLFGMNVLLPFASREEAFYIVLALILAASACLALLFKKYRWL